MTQMYQISMVESSKLLPRLVNRRDLLDGMPLTSAERSVQSGNPDICFRNLLLLIVAWHSPSTL